MMIVVMGVSGCGKSTVGRALAESLGWPFYDADDFHPPANILKMSSGIPLTDQDRQPWLERLRDLLAAEQRAGRPLVLACSALKERYRSVLRSGAPDVRFVYLKGSPQEVAVLLNRRTGHFMKPDLLDSQFAALEEPQDALNVPVLLACPAQVQQIREAWKL